MNENKRSMAKTVLKYVLVVVVLLLLLLPAKYINSIYGYLPFFFALFILIFSVVDMLLIRHGVSVESDFNDAECIRGEAVRISLKVRNNSIYVCPKAETTVYISDIFGQSDDETDMVFTMAAKTVNDFSFDMEMTHIGVYHVGLRNLWIYDLLGIFKVSVPINGDFTVNVAPRIRELEELEVSDDVQAETEADTRNYVVGGMNYTGVREYEYGDSMKQIHWKLSAKSPTYVTKLNESSRQSDYVVIIDFAAPDYEREELMDVNDCLIETGISCLEALAREDVAYSLIFNDRHKEMQRTTPSQGYYTDVVNDFSVITPDPKPGYPDAVKLLADESGQLNRSSNILLVTSRVTDALIQELIDIKASKRNPELFYIIPERLNSREREALEAPLESLGDSRIDYHMISTAINHTASEDESSWNGDVSGDSAGEVI